MILLTTTVSVDSQRDDYNQVTINLVQGDVGTRRFQMVPVSGGVPVMIPGNVAYAKILALSTGGTELLINCAIESGKIYMEPPQALVQYGGEWQCQLVLLNSSQQTLTSMKFTIIVHSKLFTGDTVEHTNTSITSIDWISGTQTLAFHLADGSTLYAGPMTHTHANATTSAAGFESAADKTNLDLLVSRVNQDLRTNAETTPSFPNLNIGTAITINGTTGVVTGMRFT